MRLIDADALIDRIKNPYEQAQVARWVNEQPTIEPEKRTEKRTETHACDLIDREAAVDAIYHHLPSVSRMEVRLMLHEVPSAQPEIIRCKECKYRDADDFCAGRGYPNALVPDDGFCDKGERREDG